ncbi:kynurenine 3-monooxygenase [Linderina pennispora]|uniref:Kynurenine 3-monooxygenase n=1 Tax=Linderina pennispora TaxID=61395 RepID=A0A1Y1WDD7_9FUNG|nr:kynurenine 3-monooxygenase [Linderina pennispora]ORX71174.1 kynurenine 3-monooxygenase [Linderina pennispora]
MPERNVVIIGGGLVGSLTACYFAKRGWQVDLYEKRPGKQFCLPTWLSIRSINLAISERGFSALRRLDPTLEKRVKALVIPMHGRMIHSLDGTQTSQAYDVFGKAINSVGRSTLIRVLLDEASQYKNVRMHFNHEFQQADFDAGRADSDLIVGADGAYSRVRQRLMAKVMLNYSQTYIEHGYCEFSMPPRNGDFAISPSHLHIWPRQSFMLIALPNQDKSFTVTLFDQLKTGQDAVEFFRANFPDALDLMGADKVASEYMVNPKGSLMYVKCTPYTYKNRAVVIGDAAHAMVPFYGQGMNCGFEDIEELDKIMLSVARDGMSDDQILRALDTYSSKRTKDASAIVDLALDNYVEMRAKVIDYAYLARKHLEGLLHRVFPKHIIPLYTMVSFTSIPYAAVIGRWQRQSLWLHRAVRTAFAAAAFAVGVASARVLGLRAPSLVEVARLFTKRS